MTQNETRPTYPTGTPWGRPDNVTEVAVGIVSYSTPSHGGYWLSPERVAEMPKPLRDFVPFGGPQSGPGRWFEEDCDWSIVALAFPQFFSDGARAAALATLKVYKPELHKELTAPCTGVGCVEIRQAGEEKGR